MPSSPAPIRRILRRLYKTRLFPFTSAPYAMSCTKEIPKRESKGDSEKMKKFLSMALCAVMVLGILAGLAPVFRAMAIKPIDAIRDE